MLLLFVLGWAGFMLLKQLCAFRVTVKAMMVGCDTGCSGACVRSHTCIFGPCISVAHATEQVHACVRRSDTQFRVPTVRLSCVCCMVQCGVLFTWLWWDCDMPPNAVWGMSACCMPGAASRLPVPVSPLQLLCMWQWMTHITKPCFRHFEAGVVRNLVAY